MPKSGRKHAMKKLILLTLISLQLGFLPALAVEDETGKNAEMMRLLESKIDLSKPATRGEQTFSYLLDIDGKQVADLTEFSPDTFSEGLAMFQSDVKVKQGANSFRNFGQTESGFFDTTGNKVIPATFDRCGRFSEGLAWTISKTQEYGYINRAGKIVFTVKDCCQCKEFSEGMASFRGATIIKGEDEQDKVTPGKYGYLDKTGNVAIEPKYESTKSFSQGRAAVKLDGKWFFIDKNGKQVSETFDKASNYFESLAAVCNDSKWGYINLESKLVIPYTYDDAQKFSEGLAVVRVGEHIAFINPNGKTVVEPKFNDAYPFTQGLAGVQNSLKKWGFIDKSGKFVIDPVFDDIDSFSCGRALVKKGIMFGYIDLQGKYVVEPKFVIARSYSDDRAVVADKNWNHPIMRGMLMGAHLEGMKIHKDSNSATGIYIPISFEDALKELDDILPPAAKRDIQMVDQSEMISYHHGFGTWMRNNWGLWKGGPLSKDMQRLGFTHPDDMSGTIFESYWLKVHGKPINLKAKSEHYKKYWEGAKFGGRKDVKIPTGKLPPPKK